MMVSSDDKRRPSRRAERGSMEHVVPGACVCDPLKVRRLNRPTECSVRAKPNVIRQDQESVRSGCWRCDSLWKIRGRVFYGAADFALKRRLGLRQYYFLVIHAHR